FGDLEVVADDAAADPAEQRVYRGMRPGQVNGESGDDDVTHDEAPEPQRPWFLAGVVHDSPRPVGREENGGRSDHHPREDSDGEEPRVHQVEGERSYVGRNTRVPVEEQEDDQQVEEQCAPAEEVNDDVVVEELADQREVAV